MSIHGIGFHSDIATMPLLTQPTTVARRAITAHRRQPLPMIAEESLHTSFNETLLTSMPSSSIITPQVPPPIPSPSLCPLSTDSGTSHFTSTHLRCIS